MKSLRSSLILLLLAVVGGIYLYWNERGAAVSQGAVVLLRAPQNHEVRRVTLHPSNLTIENDGYHGPYLVRDGKTGRRAPLDIKQELGLWTQLALVQSDLPVTNPTDLAQYGLQPPRAWIEVDGRKLEFGAPSRFDLNLVYARGNGHIGLVSAVLFSKTQKSFDQWRDRDIWRGSADDIGIFSLRNASAQMRFSSDEMGKWTVDAPKDRVRDAAADADVVTNALRALSSARVTRWLDESGKNAARYGFNANPLRVESGGLKLEIGARVGKGYAARRPGSEWGLAIFEVPETLFALLNRPLRDWRDKTIARFDLNTATRLQIETQGKSKILFKKSGSGWNIENGATNSKTNAAALDLLSFAAALRARDFIDAPRNPAQYGLDKPLLTLQIEADTPLNLRFGRAKNQLYAQQIGNASSNPIFSLSRDALDAIQETLAQLGPKPPK